MLQGKTIKITLPDAFVNTGVPVETVFTPTCTPPDTQCSTGILLQGWPQHPIFPMFPPGSGPPEFYTTSAEGSHTIVLTALTDVTSGMMLPGPGIKQIHFGFGFVNPDAGTYEIKYDWPDAQATLELWEGSGKSQVTIEVQDARPSTYFTVWLRMRGNDIGGESFGGSPLTGGGATPLAPTSELGNLLAATGPGNGSDQLANGFYTDGQGNATFQIELDFPIINGAYPFQKFDDFDPTDDRFPIDNPRVYPVAIVGAEGPFTIRLASHCIDSQGHGLGPGDRESWLQWTLPS